MSGFASLRKSSQDFDALKEKLSTSNNNSNNDNWYPLLDSSGQSYVKIRFLPGADGETHVAKYSKFNAPNDLGTKTYGLKNRRNLGESDPMGEVRNALWKKVDDSGKSDEMVKEYRKYKLKRLYVCYIYIIDDRVTPDNNGKIMKYYMPKTIMDKVAGAFESDNKYDEDFVPFNPFDIYGETTAGGREFIMQIKIKDKHYNYDDSKFAASNSPWLPDEDKMEALWTEHVKDLSELVDPSKYPTFEKGVELLIETFGTEQSLIGGIIREMYGDDIKKLGTEKASKKSEKIDKEVKKETKKKVEKPKEKIKAEESVSPDEDEDEDFDLDFE